MPSLHFGYALLAGGATAWLARPRAIRIAGALYPLVLLFVIVGTGNHYYFDALAGTAVALAAGLVARTLARDVSPTERPHGENGARSESAAATIVVLRAAVHSDSSATSAGCASAGSSSS